ncbi:unnamed protein product, partial [Vitis vinifera]
MILLFLYGSDTLILCIDASSFHCLIVCTLWWLQESETGRCCAQLVKPVNYVPAENEGRTDSQATS